MFGIANFQQVIDNGVTVEQGFAAVQDHGGHPDDRLDLGDLIRVFGGRQFDLFVIQAQKLQCD